MYATVLAGFIIQQRPFWLDQFSQHVFLIHGVVQRSSRLQKKSMVDSTDIWNLFGSKDFPRISHQLNWGKCQQNPCPVSVALRKVQQTHEAEIHKGPIYGKCWPISESDLRGGHFNLNSRYQAFVMSCEVYESQQSPASYRSRATWVRTCATSEWSPVTVVS